MNRTSKGEEPHLAAPLLAFDSEFRDNDSVNYSCAILVRSRSAIRSVCRRTSTMNYIDPHELSRREID
jgi:hypothetical protein